MKETEQLKKLMEAVNNLAEHGGPRALDELNGLSDKYELYIEQNSGGEVLVVYTKGQGRMVGAFDDLDSLLDTGLEH